MNSAWDSFRLRLDVTCEIERLYQLWTTKEGLESWFLRRADFWSEDGSIRAYNEPAQAGDRFLWQWHGYDDSVKEERQVELANGKDSFAFRFSENCLVTVRLFEEKQTSFIELVQSEIPWNDDPKRNLHVQCSVGWTFYLGNLKSLIQSGVDLRNKRTDIQNVISA